MGFTEKLIALKEEFNEAKFELYKKLALNERGSMDVGAIIGLGIGIIFIAAVAPAAIETFYQTNTSTWQIDGVEDAKTTTIWWLLPFIAVTVFLYMLYRKMN